MKQLTCFLLIGLAGCASPKRAPFRVRPMPVSSIGATQTVSIRYPEVVKGYYIGWYIEPNDQLVMHEQHTMYRVEAIATWNRHPGRSCPPAGVAAAGLTNAAYSPAPTNDAIIAELAHQKAVTHLVITQENRLGASLQQLGQALREIQSMAIEDHRLRRELAGVVKRVDALEGKLKAAPLAQAQAGARADPPSPEPTKGAAQ